MVELEEKIMKDIGLGGTIIITMALEVALI
jgi:hypothetical protein